MTGDPSIDIAYMQHLTEIVVDNRERQTVAAIVAWLSSRAEEMKGSWSEWERRELLVIADEIERGAWKAK